MLDVHPPHSPTHTGKDFFIHVGTICVGLLIAIGLEQTVEFFHHREQLHQLHEDLHAESLRNLNIALANIDECSERLAAGRALYREVVLANRDHRPPALQHTPVRNTYVKPAYAVWTVAQQSGTLNLLPREEAQRYVRVYSLIEQTSDVLALQNNALLKLNDALAPGSAVTSTDQRTPDPIDKLAAWEALNPEDLRDARNALAQVIDAESYGINRNVFLYGVEWSVLHGSQSDEENLRVLFDAQATYDRGGKAALLAKYPLPKDDTTTLTPPEQ